MMEELASHIMDLTANSLRAGARLIEVSMLKTGDTLTLMVRDDGSGMDAETVRRVQDPFFSTKTGRTVGLGIPLLKGTAETTGGSFSIVSEPGRGTEITAVFDLHHPDLPPVGNLKDTILVLVVGNPDVDFLFRFTGDGKDFTLDTKELKKVLDGVPLNHPEVIKFLSKNLDESL